MELFFFFFFIFFFLILLEGCKNCWGGGGERGSVEGAFGYDWVLHVHREKMGVWSGDHSVARPRGRRVI